MAFHTDELMGGQGSSIVSPIVASQIAANAELRWTFLYILIMQLVPGLSPLILPPSGQCCNIKIFSSHTGCPCSVDADSTGPCGRAGASPRVCPPEPPKHSRTTTQQDTECRHE